MLTKRIGLVVSLRTPVRMEKILSRLASNATEKKVGLSLGHPNQPLSSANPASLSQCLGCGMRLPDRMDAAYGTDTPSADAMAVQVIPASAG
jgi:hypothetical protein